MVSEIEVIKNIITQFFEKSNIEAIPVCKKCIFVV